MSTKKNENIKKKGKPGTVGIRLTGDLKNIFDKAIELTKVSKTEFLERAIKHEIRSLSKEYPEIQKMIDATVKKVSAID